MGESCPFCGATGDEVCKVGCTMGTTVDLIEVTPRGGRHTRLDERCELLPPSAQLEKAKVLREGAANYGVDNWRLIPQYVHLNHALTHLFKYLESGERKELVHAACRLDFALETLNGRAEVDGKRIYPQVLEDTEGEKHTGTHPGVRRGGYDIPTLLTELQP